MISRLEPKVKDAPVRILAAHVFYMYYLDYNILPSSTRCKMRETLAL